MIVRLSDITPGSARVRTITPAGPGAAFGWSTPVGHVRRQSSNRWMAYDASGTLVGGLFATRKEAANYLAHRAKKEQTA